LIVATYDLLAPHYDAVTGDSSTEVAFIDSIIRNALPRPVTLLEVACGTGGILASLAGTYRVTGLDISPGMLAVARGKLPAGTPLHVADMSCFELDAKFDAIICVYHGINHLVEFPSWTGFFDCACGHLNDGGVLVFDIITIDTLKMMTGSPEMVQQFDGHSLHLTVRAAGESVFDWDIKVLAAQRDGRREVLTEVIRTASFPPEEIRNALSERFAGIEIIESDGGVGGDGENRIWFVCTMPRSTPQNI